MKRVTVVFEDDGLYRDIKVEAARLGLPVKAVVSEALREWLPRHQRLSEADRERRREALAVAARLRQEQSSGVGSIEEDLEALRQERSWS